MKTALNKFWLRCTMCALLLGLQVCDNSPYVTEILLRANFDADSPGDYPDKTLPGNPIGDELEYSDQSPLHVITNSIFVSGGPTLLHQYFSSVDISQMQYITRPTSLSGIVRFSWNGQLVNWVNIYQVLYITIDDEHGKVLVKLGIAGQMLKVLHAGDESWHTGDTLGYPFPAGSGGAATNHAFVIEVDYAHKTFDLTLAGQNLTQNVFKYTDLPTFDPSVVLSANTRLRLRIFAAVADNGGPCGYVTDNVIISRKFVSIPNVDL